eukprot:9489847-Pyramimonas_sp.AAC.3
MAHLLPSAVRMGIWFLIASFSVISRVSALEVSFMYSEPDRWQIRPKVPRRFFLLKVALGSLHLGREGWSPNNTTMYLRNRWQGTPSMWGLKTAESTVAPTL